MKKRQLPHLILLTLSLLALFSLGQACLSFAETAPAANAAAYPLTLTAASATKTYDGDPLNAPTCTYDPKQLQPDHAVEATVTGSITVCGTAPNVIIAWTVRDALGADVTGQYQITRVDGTLTVTPARFPLTLSAAGLEKTYDGLPAQNSNYTYTLSQLRPGHTLKATVEGAVTLPGWDFNAVTAWEIRDAYGRDVTENYNVSTRRGILRVHRGSHPLEITAASGAKVFDGTPLVEGSYAYDATALMPGDRLEATVEGAAIHPGESANRVTAWQVLREDGTDVSANYAVTTLDGALTITPASLPLLLTAGSAEKTYDGTPLREEGFAYDASALADGLRVEASVEGEITQAGQAANRIVACRVLDAEGTDITVNFAVTTVDGTLTVHPAHLPLTLTAASAEKTYDGTPLAKDGIAYDEAALLAGGRVEATVEGVATTPGSAANRITAYAVYDRDGQDVTGNYAVTTVDGTLTIHRASRPLRVTAASAGKAYDGIPLSDGGYTLDTAQLFAGDTAQVIVEGSITDMGETPNRVASCRILSSGGIDVTDCYQITAVDGVLSITSAERALTITAGSAEKPYDGTPLVATDFAHDPGALLPGHTLTAVVEGAQTEVGQAASTVAGWQVTGENGADMSAHYAVTLQPGTLTVLEAASTPAPIATPTPTPAHEPVPSTPPAGAAFGTATYHSHYPPAANQPDALFQDPRPYAPGEALVLPDPEALGFAVPGMTFLGWTTDPQSPLPLADAVMADADIDLYALWGEGFLLTIRFMDEGYGYALSQPVTAQVAAGASYTYEPALFSGYTATGAHLSTDAPETRVASAGEGQMPAENLTITIYYALAR